jgi:signal transduction protein with GAF and PtsI domain
MELLGVQIKFANAEISKAETAQQNVQLKAAVETNKAMFEKYKQDSTTEIARLKQDLEEAKAVIDQQGKTEEVALRKYEIDSRNVIELTRMEVESATQQDENYKQNQETVNG